MATCEYQESDIMFPEHGGHQESEDMGFNYLFWPQQTTQQKTTSGRNNVGRDKQKKLIKYSLPIGIPERDHFDREDEFDAEQGCGGETEVVPPHLIVARRVAGNMEFSVCSGKGRTLKGRDLKEVRNEILRMTGFLEAN